MNSFSLLCLSVLGLVVVACFPQNKPEYVASNADFVDYNKWTFVDKVSGNSDATKGAHLSDDPTTSRTIYIKNNADRTDNGKFPVGTTLVKQYTNNNNQVLGITAMVKRGGGFNKEGGAWEWFVLDPKTGQIALDAKGTPTRGAIAMCNQCHIKTKENDFVFTR